MVKPFSWEGPVQIKTVRFVKSVVDRTGIPDDPFPQIAIAGRSNVGKSSLINALLHIRRNVTRGDAQLLQWLAVNRKPVTLVLTKADKFKASKRANQVRQWQRELEAVGIRETPIVFSVSKKLGRDHLLEVMARSVEA